MPKAMKRKRKNITENKTITKRLLEISLKVDKYVYKQKPILIAEAEAYIDEVNKYKALCLQDARSLQVIEKLRRCMKAIIKEQTDDASKGNEGFQTHTQNVVRYVASPVYSLSDEDSTPMMECMNSSDDLDNTVLSISDSQLLTQPMDKLAETINHRDCNTNDLAFASNSLANDKETEENRNMELIERVIDLTLCDKEHVTDDPICSQSILNADIPNDILYNDTDNTCAQDMTEVDKEVDKIMQKQHGDFDNPNDNINTFHSIVQNEPNKPKNILPSKIITKPAESFEIQEMFYKISNDNEFKKKVATKANKKKTNTEKTTDKKIKRERKPKSLGKCKNKSNVIDIKQKPSDTLTSQTECSVKIHGKSKNIPNRPNVQETNPKIPTKMQFTDDISWIENIRYVREINIQEYDPKLNYLLDSFWENCHLPESWDDAEFE